MLPQKILDVGSIVHLEVDVRDDGNETASVAAAAAVADALYRPFSKRLFSVYI